jgi:hypothetical protein
MTVLAWAKAFVLTLVVEMPIVFTLLRRLEPSAARLMALAAFASLATHPVVWFVFPALPLDPWTCLVLSEVWAIVVEAGFFVLAFRGLSWRRAAAVSLIANGTSFALGQALYNWCAQLLHG